MKTWFKKRKIKKLRERLLQAREEQMHHRLIMEHYDDVVQDMETELRALNAFHADSKLIDFSQHTLTERKIFTAGQI